MKEIKIELNTLKLNFPGGAEEIKFPSARVLHGLEKELADKGEKESLGVYKEMFLNLGMSEKNFDILEMGHIKQILEEFVQAPK